MDLSLSLIQGRKGILINCKPAARGFALSFSINVGLKGITAGCKSEMIAVYPSFFNLYIFGSSGLGLKANCVDKVLFAVLSALIMSGCKKAYQDKIDPMTGMTIKNACSILKLLIFAKNLTEYRAIRKVTMTGIPM